MAESTRPNTTHLDIAQEDLVQQHALGVDLANDPKLQTIICQKNSSSKPPLSWAEEGRACACSAKKTFETGT
jgi:hypothetical protein